MPKFSFVAKNTLASILYYYITNLGIITIFYIHYKANTFCKAFRKLSIIIIGHSYAAIMLNLALLPLLSFRYHITIF